MKVNLAAQTLSRSVADALDFCRDCLKLSEFKGSEATSKYIRMIDHLFDIMNSRSAFGKGSKSPMRESNELEWKSFFSSAEDYLRNLKTIEGQKLVQSLRKTAFVGFIVDIHSFDFLFQSLVKQGPLKYFLTYKCSQDHLELFFCAVRSRLGANTNPNTVQFRCAYKQLLLHNQIRGNRGNCLIQDDTSILNFDLKHPKKSIKSCDSENILSTAKKFGFLESEDEHDYSLLAYFPALSEYQSAVLEYIAGFCVIMAQKELKCDECFTALYETPDKNNYLLVNHKDRGGLIHVGPSVRVICEESERLLQKMIILTPNTLPFHHNVSLALTSSVLRRIVNKFD